MARLFSAVIFAAMFAAGPLLSQAIGDASFDAVLLDLNAGDYRPASVIVSNLISDIRRKWNSDISNARKSEALHTAVNRDATLTYIDQARSSCKRGDWETALFDLELVQKGLATLEMQLTPAERTERDAAEAERRQTPGWFHQAARSAYEMGDFNRALQYSSREIQSIPGFFPRGFSALAYNRAYTVLGLSQLALQDVSAAIDSLQNSVRFTDGQTLRDVTPSMTLARQLLLSGQTDAVLTFLDQSQKVSSSTKTAEWKDAIKAGRVPDFGAAGRLN